MADGHITPQNGGINANALGIPIRLIAVGPDTGEQMDVLEAEFPAGMSFAAHIHHNSDEGMYVLEGELMLRIGDQRTKVSRGAFGLAPRGVAHGFVNESGQTAKILAWQSPSWGAGSFFEALSKLPPGEPDMNRLMEIFRQHDFEPVND